MDIPVISTKDNTKPDNHACADVQNRCFKGVTLSHNDAGV